MQKSKHKIEQRTFWQRFYDDYILLRHDFRYEIDRKPKKAVATFQKFWQRQRGKKHVIGTLNRYGYSNEIKIDELKKNELWNIDIDFRDGFFTKAKGQAYVEDEKTIIEISTSFEEVVSPFILGLLAIIFFAIWVIRLAVPELTFVGFLLFSFLSLLLFSQAYRIRSKAYQKHKDFLKYLENFAIEEEEKLDAEWERLYGKTKNDDSPEILKAKRK